MPGRMEWQELLGAQGRMNWQEQLGQVTGPPPASPPPPAPIVAPLSPAPAPRMIRGTALPGATVQIVINLVPHLTISADSNGDWAFVFNVPAGNYSIEARQIVDDRASEYSTPLAFVIQEPEPVDPNVGHGVTSTTTEEKKRPPEVGRLSVPFRRPTWPGGPTS